MAIAIRGSTPAQSTVTTAAISVTLTGTRQPQAGDVLVIFHGNNYFNLSNMPTPTVGGSTTGVTSIVTADNGANAAHVRSFYYVVTATGDATVAVTETGTADEEKQLCVYVLSGCDTSTVTDGTATSWTSFSATNHVLPSITTTTTDAMLFAHLNCDGDGFPPTSYTPPGSPWVEDLDVNFDAFFSSTQGHEQLTASGATGTRTFVTLNGATPTARSSSGVLLAIRTAGAAVSTYQGPRPFPPWAAPWIEPRVRPAQLLGDASGQLNIYPAETATGDDSLTVSAVFSVADTATGDDSLVVAAAVPMADTANPTDELSVSRPEDATQVWPYQFWAMVQPGTGPHAPILQLLGDSSGQQLVSLADSAAGDDLLALAPAIPLTDTATGTDSLSITVAAPLAETATATDLVVVAAAVPVAETATGDDSLTAQAVGAADAFQVPRWLPGMLFNPRASTPQSMGDSAAGTAILTDTATGDDSLAVTSAVPLADTATADDSLTVAATTSLLTDTAAGADALAASVVAVLDDSVTALESLAVVIAGEPDANQFLVPNKWGITRPGVVMDPPALQLLGDASGTYMISLTETATADDSLTISVAVTMTETAAGADSLATAIAVPLSELVAAADSLALVAVLALSQTATADDNLYIAGQGIIGGAYPDPASGASGNVYPRGSRAVIGSVG